MRQNTLLTICFLVTLIIGVPWYWRFFPDLATRVIVGFPVWVIVSLFASLTTSILVALTLRVTWPFDLSDE